LHREERGGERERVCHYYMYQSSADFRLKPAGTTNGCDIILYKPLPSEISSDLHASLTPVSLIEDLKCHRHTIYLALY
jgi:hypothetical protein